MTTHVLSVRHTGTRWVIQALRQMGCRVKVAHTFDAYFDEIVHCRPAVVPMRDPVRAKLGCSAVPTLPDITAGDFERIAALWGKDGVHFVRVDTCIRCDTKKLAAALGLDCSGVDYSPVGSSGVPWDGYGDGVVPGEAEEVVAGLRASVPVMRMLRELGYELPWTAGVAA